MQDKEVRSLIEAKLKKNGIIIRNKNAIGAFIKLFPPLSSLWQVLSGAQDALETERGRITQEVILKFLCALDEKLEGIITTQQQDDTFQILLESVRAYGDVTGLKACTSNPELRQLFSQKEVQVVLSDIQSLGNVTGVNLTVDEEVDLNKHLNIKTPNGSVKFNPGEGRNITFGKGMKHKK
ncbi:MAG: hypothetical protein MUQ00_12410 [Candidatus Aminicenantes bacterium]|nr:hypothetical protein [Candidatus Aminicenantes bacterium]